MSKVTIRLSIEAQDLQHTRRKMFAAWDQLHLQQSDHNILAEKI